MEHAHRTIIAPLHFRAVEPLGITTAAERAVGPKRSDLNPFVLHADEVLTDSATDAASAALMVGDESYAGSRSFYRLERAVRELTGTRNVVPATEQLDTTRANVEFLGGDALVGRRRLGRGGAEWRGQP